MRRSYLENVYIKKIKNEQVIERAQKNRKNIAAAFTKKNVKNFLTN